MAIRDHFLVAVVDTDTRVQDAIAAILFLELGARSITAGSLTALLSALANMTADVIIVGDHPAAESEQDAVGAISARFPRIPLVALRSDTLAVPGADIVLPRPVDGMLLVDTIQDMLVQPASISRSVIRPSLE